MEVDSLHGHWQSHWQPVVGSHFGRPPEEELPKLLELDELHDEDDEELQEDDEELQELLELDEQQEELDRDELEQDEDREQDDELLDGIMEDELEKLENDMAQSPF